MTNQPAIDQETTILATALDDLRSQLAQARVERDQARAELVSADTTRRRAQAELRRQDNALGELDEAIADALAERDRLAKALGEVLGSWRPVGHGGAVCPDLRCVVREGGVVVAKRPTARDVDRWWAILDEIDPSAAKTAAHLARLRATLEQVRGSAS